MEEQLKPEIIEKIVGRLKVLAIFRTEKSSMIIGGKVVEGEIMPEMKVRVIRNKEEIGRGKISRLQIENKVVKEVAKGQECGITFNGETRIKVDDYLEVFQEEKIYKKIELKNAQ